jgi:hypothetical protein
MTSIMKQRLCQRHKTIEKLIPFDSKFKEDLTVLHEHKII